MSPAAGRVGEAAVAIAAQHLRDDHLIAAQPLLVALFGRQMLRVVHQLAQAGFRTVQTLAMRPVFGLATFFAEITVGLPGGSGDLRIQSVKFVVELAGVENEGGPKSCCLLVYLYPLIPLLEQLRVQRATAERCHSWSSQKSR